MAKTGFNGTVDRGNMIEWLRKRCRMSKSWKKKRNGKQTDQELDTSYHIYEEIPDVIPRRDIGQNTDKPKTRPELDVNECKDGLPGGCAPYMVVNVADVNQSFMERSVCRVANISSPNQLRGGGGGEACVRGTETILARCPQNHNEYSVAVSKTETGNPLNNLSPKSAIGCNRGEAYATIATRHEPYSHTRNLETTNDYSLVDHTSTEGWYFNSDHSVEFFEDSFTTISSVWADGTGFEDIYGGVESDSNHIESEDISALGCIMQHQSTEKSFHAIFADINPRTNIHVKRNCRVTSSRNRLLTDLIHRNFDQRMSLM